MWYSWYFNFSHSNRYVELFHRVLICMYQVPIEVELQFMNLLIIWFLEVLVKISCLILLNVFFLLIHEFLIFLDMNSVLQVYSLLCDLTFHWFNAFLIHIQIYHCFPYCWYVGVFYLPWDHEYILYFIDVSLF